MGALLLDYLFMGIYIYIISALYPLLFVSGDFAAIVYTITFLPVMCYSFIFESFFGGKTLGKMIAKIRVTNIDGSIPGTGAYFLRWILKPVDMFPGGGIGTLFIVFSSRHQRLGDMAAGTTVVRTNMSLSSYLDEDFYVFDENYTPTFKDVTQLTEGQITFITNTLFLTRGKGIAAKSLFELANKVKSTLEIDSHVNDRRFLETIVRDYNYYAVYRN
jgi:uncharacterized RDD family membrane protein YckC